MSEWTDSGVGVHIAPSGVLYIDGKPYEMVGVPRITYGSYGIEDFETTVQPKSFAVSFTLEPGHEVVVAWPGGKPPAWLQDEMYEHVHAFARELSACSALPLSDCVQAVLNVIAPVKRVSSKRNRLPKPSTTPPMWAHDPARTRRSRNRATNIRTPKT